MRIRHATAAAVVFLAGCEMPTTQAPPWCSAGAENGQPSTLIVTIEPESKPEPDRQSCRVRPGSLLTWQPAGSLAHTFEGVEFTAGTPDTRGRTRITADPTGTPVEIRVKPARQREVFPYLVWAGGQGHDPEVIVDP